jgi:PAS domain S-box-containing protein
VRPLRDARVPGLATVAILAVASLIGPPPALALRPEEDLRRYAHTAWRVRDGALRDSVAAIAQTPDGYLWLGTQFGLIRFDGVRHVLWQPPDGQVLPSMNVRRLFVDSGGRLWIGTQLGLASWKDGRLTLHPEVRGQVGGIIEDRTGTVWVGTRYPPPGRLCAIRRDGVRCFGGAKEFGARASSVYEDRAGTLWVGSASGVWRWAPGQPTHVAFADFESSRGLAEADDGAFLVAERKAVRQLVAGKVVDYPPIRRVGTFQPSHLVRDRHGGLWIGTFDRGLIHLRQGRAEVFSQADGLSGNYIRDVFEDREGNIWVATDNGLDRFRHTAVTTVSVKHGLSHTTPWSVLAASDGSVWVGTLDGLNRLEGEQITIYRQQPSRSRPAAANGAGGTSGPAGPRGTLNAVVEIVDDELPDNLIQSLFEDARKRIWVSTRRGVAFFENGRFHRLPGVPGGVHAMTGTADGSLWISEDDGLFHVVGGRVAAHTSWAALGRDVPAMPIVTDPVRGGVWLAFRDGSGLAYFDAGRITGTFGAAQGLGRGIVGDLHLDSGGVLWAATEGGLSRIENGRVHTLTSRDGLPCDGVNWAIEDDHRTWWLYTACGLARIAGSQLDAWAAAVGSGATPTPRIQAALYDSSDGVRIHAAPGGYMPHVGKSPDGRIWFLPWDGVSIIDPRYLPFNNLPPPVQIERITVDDRSYAPAAGLELPPLARDITIEFTALSLAAPEKIRFRYRLEGQDPQWREASSERYVQYSNLAPGPYRFRVLASNNSGVWNETGAVLQFTLLPASYQTTWFRFLAVAVGLSALGVAYRHRIRQLHRERRRLQEVVDRIPAIAGIARPDGSNEYLNRRWVEYTGVSAADVAGTGWLVAVHPEDQDRYAARWAESLGRGEPFEIEARLRSAKGEYRWFLLRAVPVRDKKGSISNWHAVMTDIEDRKNAERELESLSGRLIHAQEEERSRIGRELHDDINQSLGLIAIRLDQLRADAAMPPDVARGLDRLKEDTIEVATHVHRLSHQLHSTMLDYLGLVPALHGLIDNVASRHGVEVALIEESPSGTIPPNLALCLFRIAQEGLTNIVRHSQARSAKVRIRTSAEGAHLEVEDDGIGFDPARLEQHAGLGFVSMRERLRGFHGRVRIDSAPGRGTRIVVDVPLPDGGVPDASNAPANLRARSTPA